MVVGGGNSGVEAAIDLAAICRTVTLLQRGGQLTADEVLVKKLLATTNAKVIYNMTVESLEGNGQLLTGVAIKTKLRVNSKSSPLRVASSRLASCPILTGSKERSR